MNPTHHHGCCSCSCGKQRPTDVLKDEHRVIERVLSAVERKLAAPPVDRAFFATAIDFLRNFADGCHHAKEEQALFPALAQAGVPQDGGPIGCMLDEHQAGRALILEMNGSLDAAAEGDAAAATRLHQAARQYVQLLRQHIWKEDNVLFELADQRLDRAQQSALLEAFDRTEHTPANAGRHAHYLHLAAELERAAAGDRSGARMESRS